MNVVVANKMSIENAGKAQSRTGRRLPTLPLFFFVIRSNIYVSDIFVLLFGSTEKWENPKISFQMMKMRYETGSGAAAATAMCI